jgi:Arc/MetJ-type ribon-helix-helix transcriptional regulator
MHAEKLSISLPKSMVYFLSAYQQAHDLHSRSEVIKIALKLLQRVELEQHYKEASKEVDEAFDITISDGLDDEAW